MPEIHPEPSSSDRDHQETQPLKRADEDQDLDSANDWVKVGPAATAGVEPAVPKLLWFRVCDPEVVRLGNALARKAKTPKEKTAPLSMSWCVGPCIRRLFFMLSLNFVMPTVFLAIGYFTAHCRHGTLQYSYPIAFMGVIPWALLCVYQEHICLRHVTIPYAQHVGTWKVMGIAVSFFMWNLFTFCLTAIDVVGSVTPSLFTGVIIARRLRDECDTMDKLTDVWNHMAEESFFMRHFNCVLTMCATAFLLWVLQLTPFVYCVLKVWPGWRQWQAGALDLNKGQPYDTGLELEVVEFCSNHGRGRSTRHSQMSKSRPHGTRFFYFSICKEFMLTGAVFGIVGDAVGFASMTEIQKQHARSSAEYQMEVLQKISDDCTTQDFKRGVSIGKKFMQHYLSLAPTLKQRLFFKGILGDGLQLQLQITVFAMFKFLSPSEMHAAQLWISIFASFCKIPVAMMEVFACVKFNALASTVATKLDLMSNQCQKKYAKDQMQDDIEAINEMRGQSTRTLLEFYIFTGMLIWMYIWAFAKLWMTHVCDDNMWNVNINMLAGCVTLPDRLRLHGGD